MIRNKLDSGWVTLTHRQAPGDSLVATAFLRDLARAHPGRFRVHPNFAFSPLLDGSPYVERTGRPKNCPYLKLCYGRVLRDGENRTVHFLTAFHENFHEQTGIYVPVTDPKPDLHFVAGEEEPLISGRYWVINAGGKADFTTKLWEHAKYQRVVDMLAERGISCVQVGMLKGSRPAHIHKPLNNVINLLDKTNLRQLMRILRDSEGVICGVTMCMHMAAALDKNCVVVAGGREHWYWEAYVRENTGLGPKHKELPVPHSYLHSIGLLDCCPHHGCWKCHVYNPNVAHAPKNLCTKPVKVGEQYYPLCLHIIEPEHVVECVMNTYEDKSLPAIQLKQPLPELLQQFPIASEAIPNLNVAHTHTPRLHAPRPPSQPLVARQAPQLVATTRREPSRPAPATPVWDNPILGGKATMFVLMYGEYPDMHRRCLEAIIKTVPKERRELRVGSNQLGQTSAEFVAELVRAGEISVHYRHAGNDRKYPVMREMFHDPKRPITTPYLTWFDDDTYCDKDPAWFNKLGECIVDHHPHGARCFGPPYFFPLNPKQRKWAQEGKWYKRRPWCSRSGREGPNEIHVPFASGSFWALHVDTMRLCDIPDARIGHNGGDYMIGAQLWQNKIEMQPFSGAKSIVNWSAEPRRGLAEKHTGM